MHDIDRMDEDLSGSPGKARFSRDGEETRRHVWLWVAVGGTMAFILVFWVVLLPMQFADVGDESASETDRWQVIRDGSAAAPSISGSLESVRQQLEELSEGLAEEPELEAMPEAGGEPEDFETEFEKLKERIEGSTGSSRTGQQ